LPDGNIFGTKDSDEFTISLDEKQQGVFKRFEYLSVPFSIQGKRNQFQEILRRASYNKTSFDEELKKDQSAMQTVDSVIQHMQQHPHFSRQTLDTLLPEAYLTDICLANIQEPSSLEDHAAKVVVAWKQLADFYCIEGLVGGDGARNPFTEDAQYSLIAGTLDSLESILPSIRRILDKKDWAVLSLQLASVIGRSYVQIDKATDVLESIFGSQRSVDHVEEYQATIQQLANTTFTANTELGKLYNSLIRFHNWLPANLKIDGTAGDVYDGICVPTKKALAYVEDLGVRETLLAIGDATSPKGLAIVSLIQEKRLGNKEKLHQKTVCLEERVDSELSVLRKEFNCFSLEDPVFYQGLVGGKWKGLKLLHDAKTAFNLQYKLPEGFVVSSLAIRELLEKYTVLPKMYAHMFAMDEEARAKIQLAIDEIPDSAFTELLENDDLSNERMVRSSMYGEDGLSNFSGTYDSVACEKPDTVSAMRTVMKSYFSKEAVLSRQDVGLAHIPGISFVVQERISGRGGVLHLTDEDAFLSFAETPEDAVMGNGTHHKKTALQDLLHETPLAPYADDFLLLKQIYGNIDIEFVLPDEGGIYVTQMRPKYIVPPLSVTDEVKYRIDIKTLDELSALRLEKPCIVHMHFLGRQNIMNKEAIIMDFLRENKQYVMAVEGKMPTVAHIPNKIEGHFRIPYRQRGDEDVKQ